MADNFDLESGIFLQWDTERPFVGIPRQSSSFCLLGDKQKGKLYLELALYECIGTLYQCSVRIIQESETDYLGTTVSITTSVLVKRTKQALGESEAGIFNVFGKGKSSIYIRSVSKEAVDQSHASDIWRINCLVTCNKPLSLQTNSQTIHISTTANAHLPLTSADKFVQASIEISPELERLSEDFSSLLENNIFPDVKLKCGGQTRSVHRSVLAARSEVFSAMFRNKMVESETGTVDIPDMAAPVLDLLLKYAYSAKIPDLSEDTAVNLYEAGDKYAMHSLKMLCSDWMIRNLSEENCISFLVVADTHSDAVFKDAVISFISDHQALLKSTTWLTLSKERAVLANEVYHKIFVLSVGK